MANYSGFILGCLIAVVICAPIPGANSPAAFAQTSDRDLKVRSTQPVHTWPVSSKRWALLIGVDKYDGTDIKPLNGAANDAKLLSKTLVQNAGFPPNQVILLTSEQPEDRQPTRVNIFRQLSALTSAVPKDGLLVVAFAGHGVERDGKMFLIPSDAWISPLPRPPVVTGGEDSHRTTSGAAHTQGTRASGLPSDSAPSASLLEDTSVSTIRIADRVRPNVQQVLLIVDACRVSLVGDNPRTGGTSGVGMATSSKAFNKLVNVFEGNLGINAQISAPDKAGRGAEPQPQPRAIPYEQNREVVAFAILYATASGELAYEYSNKQHGFLTWAVAQGLAGEAADEKGNVTLGELVRYVQDVVPKLTMTSIGVAQRPFCMMEGYKSDQLVISVRPR